MTSEYKTFITFLNNHVNSDNELDMIIYSIGTVQRIVEQFSQFYNQQIEKKKEYDIIDLEIEFENQCNEKIYYALGIGDSSTLFVECEIDDSNSIIFNVNINKIRIATLTLESMRDGS